MRFNYHVYFSTKIQSVCECVCVLKHSSQSQYVIKDDPELLILQSTHHKA